MYNKHTSIHPPLPSPCITHLPAHWGDYRRPATGGGMTSGMQVVRRINTLYLTEYMHVCICRFGTVHISRTSLFASAVSCR